MLESTMSLVLSRPQLAFVRASWFERLVAAAIALNAITLGLETYPSVMQQYGDTLRVLDLAFILFFVFELSMRMTAYGRAFWKDGWHWFDFIIVTVTLLPVIGVTALGNISAFRALRLLRLLSAIPSFKGVLVGLMRALRDSAAVMGVLVLLLSVFAIVAAKLFGAADPVHFGNLHTSLFTLFQIMTLDAWSDVVRPLMQVFPLAALFFGTFIVLVVFILLSTLIGIAANAMSYAHSETDRR